MRLVSREEDVRDLWGEEEDEKKRYTERIKWITEGSLDCCVFETCCNKRYVIDCRFT